MKDLNDRDFNLEAVLGETFTVTQISTEKKAMAENQQPITYNLIPKAVLSLKCLQELPIIVVLMYQLYKQFVHQVRILMIQSNPHNTLIYVGDSGLSLTHCTVHNNN